MVLPVPPFPATAIVFPKKSPFYSGYQEGLANYTGLEGKHGLCIESLTAHDSPGLLHLLHHETSAITRPR